MYLFIKTLYSDIRALPRSVYVIVLGQFLNRFGTFVYPFLTLYLGEEGYSAAEIAFVLGAMGAGNVIGPIASGYLSDAIGRKKTIVVSLVSSAVLILAIYFARTNYSLLLLMSAVYGFANFLYGPASNALLADLVPEKQRVTAYAMVRLAINGGFSIGPALGGVLYLYSPALIFYGDALTTMVFALLAFLWLPQGLKTVKGNVQSPRVFFLSWREAFLDVVGNALYKQYLCALIFMAVGFIQVYDILVVATTDKGLSPSIYGFIMGLNGFIILLIEVPMSQLLKNLPSRRVIASGYTVMALGLFLFAFADGVIGFVLAMIVFTLGELIALPVSLAYSIELSPEQYRGRYMGMRGITWGVAGLIGSIGLYGYSMIGPLWWVVAASLVFIAAAIIFYPVSAAGERVNRLKILQ